MLAGNFPVYEELSAMKDRTGNLPDKFFQKAENHLRLDVPTLRHGNYDNPDDHYPTSNG
jgi:hypothetical protein